jgi:hypothetical protein
MVSIQVELKGDVNHAARFRKALQDAFSGNSQPYNDFGTAIMAMYSSYIMRRFDRYSRGGGDWKPLAPSTIYRRAHKTVDRAKSEADANLRRGHVKGKPFGAAEHDAMVEKARKRAHSFLSRIFGFTAKDTRGIRIGPAKIAQGQIGDGQISILRDTGTLFRALAINGPGNIMRKRGPVFEFGIGGPMTHPDGKATIGQIASYHQNGGAVPNRPPQREMLVVPPASEDVWNQFDRAAQRLVAQLWQQSRGA